MRFKIVLLHSIEEMQHFGLGNIILALGGACGKKRLLLNHRESKCSKSNLSCVHECFSVAARPTHKV